MNDGEKILGNEPEMIPAELAEANAAAKEAADQDTAAAEKEAETAEKEAAEKEPETKGKGKKKKEKKSVGHEILSWVLTILTAVVAALIIRSFIFEPVRVDGESMLNTLQDGEIVLVSKYDFSSTWLTLPWQSNEAKESAARLTFGGNPQRFDIVICRYPGRGDTNFVKRVVGLPGDTVELRQGYLYINGELQDEPWVKDEYRTGSRNNYGPEVVPEGCYFVLGDHRNNSNDSRYVSALERNMIVGHVRRVVFPFSGWRGVE